MTNNEKILKRALEMAVKHITKPINKQLRCDSCNLGYKKCPTIKTYIDEGKAELNECRDSLLTHFIRKAKEAICKKN